MGRPPAGVTAEDRFFSRIERDGDCWLWTGALGGGGYALFGANGKRGMAHRWSYEHHVGPIPDGMEIDHVCHTRAVRAGTCEGGDDCQHRRCVNPAHLDVVTRVENVARGNGHGRETHCPQGHPYNDENTYITPNGWRDCRRCINRRAREYRQRRRQRSRDAVDSHGPRIVNTCERCGGVMEQANIDSGMLACQRCGRLDYNDTEEQR